MESHTNFLMPGAGFWLSLVVALALLVALVIWPLVQAIREGRVVWAVAIIVLAPLGGLAWFIAMRSPDRRSFAG